MRSDALDTPRIQYPLLFSVMAAAVAWMTACAGAGGPGNPLNVRAHELAQTQSANVPAPATPPLPAPLVEGIGIQGNYTHSFGGERWSEAPTGNFIASGSAQLRLSGRVTQAIEVGLGVDYINPGAGQVQAGTLRFEGQNDAIWRLDSSMRFSLAHRDRAELLGHVGLSWAPLSYCRRFDYTETVSYTNEDGERIEEVTSWEPTWRQGTVHYVFARAGLESGFLISPAFRLSIGLMVQNYPVFTELEANTHICSELDREACIQELGGFDHFESLNSVLIPTASLGTSVNIGPVWVVSQVFTHLDDALNVTSYTPFGLDLGVRMAF